MEIQGGNLFYGHTNIIREYTAYSSILPLPIGIQHGWLPLASKDDADVDSILPELWVWSDRIKKEYDTLGLNKNIRVIGAPIIYIECEQNEGKEKKGTIAFPGHSSHCVDIIGDYEKYAEQLAGLSEEFHPITICLYYLDIAKGYSNVFERKGFKVVSNGDMLAKEFLYNFIDNVGKCKYATTNEISSACLYASYLGLKVFYYGLQFDYFNNSDPHHPNGYVYVYKEALIKELKEKWSFKNIGQYEQQREFAKKELGVEHKKSPEELKDILKLYNKKIGVYFKRLSLKIKEKRLSQFYDECSEFKRAGKNEESLAGFDFLVKELANSISLEQKEKYIGGAYFHIGEIYLKKGDLKRAEQAFKNCLNYNKEHKKAVDYLQVKVK